MIDVVGIGEVMVLLESDSRGSLEEATGLVPSVAGAEMNLCTAVRRLGLSSSLCSRVGDDPWGRKVLLRLDELGINRDLVAVQAGYPTGMFLKEVLPDGERRVFYYRKGSAASQLAAEDGLRCATQQPRAVVISGITLALGSGPAAAVEAAARAAKEMGSWLVVDPNLRTPLGGLAAVEDDLRALLPHCDILLAGLDEASALFDSWNPQQLADKAHEIGVKELVLKNGDQGCWYEERGEMRLLRALPVNQVDPVGAGDAFGAGYLAARLRGAAPRKAAALGNRLGALVAASAGDTEGLPEAGLASRWLNEMIAV